MTLQMHYDEIAEQARTEGRAEERAKIITQMLTNGMSVDMIARCCNASEDEIKKVEEKMRSIQ